MVVVQSGIGRTVFADVGVYTSDVCPLGDADGLASLRSLFQNSVDWLLLE